MASICEGKPATRKSRATWLSGALWIAALAGIGASYQGNGADLRYGGPSQWTTTGPEGGPFTDTGFTAVLGNRSLQDLDWSASSIPSFVQLDQSSGTLLSRTRSQVHVTLRSGVAQNLTPGTYSERLTFHNNSNPGTDVDVDCVVVVRAATSSSQLLPLTDFSTQGPAAGPFQPDSQTYALTNTSTSDLHWQANPADGWLTTSPTSGHLSPGASANVSVSIVDANTAGLTNGMHHSVVEWRDASTTAVIHSRSVNLNVLAGSGSTGWTLFTPSGDTRTIYVSSSTGNDGNDGLSTATPKRTIGAGKSLVRNGYPDWLLLRRGDTWDEAIGVWNASGRSASERVLISSYGPDSERPLLRTGTSTGFDGFGWGECDNVALVGLHFWPHLFTGSQGNPRGLQLLGEVNNFLVEDCYFQAYDSNIVIMGTPDGVVWQTNIAVRRNVIVDAFTTGGNNTAGIYASGINGFLVEENLLDHNGWRDDVPGSSPNWFRRNVYIQNGAANVIFRGNILAGTDGLQQRPGGICENNLFLANALALQFGSGTTPEPNGVSGAIRHNVVLDGGNYESFNPRGWGLIIGNAVNTQVENNIVAHNVHGGAPNPWVLNFDNGHGNPQGMQNVVFDHNIIYDWGGVGQDGQVASYMNGIMRNVTFRNNDIQNNVDSTYLTSLSSSNGNLPGEIHGSNNRWYREQGNTNQMFQIAGADMSFNAFRTAIGDTTSTFGPVTYPDPNRTMATYNQSLGGQASVDAFLAQARQQSKSNWRPQYTADAANDYIREGFGLPPAGFSP